MLVQHLRGGHGRWVVPRKRLGNQFIPDFMICARDSLGLHWVAVELESPRAPLFTKSGDPAKALNHAIRQITDWRSWLKSNRDYACRNESEGGLGLEDIDGNVEGLILIGQRDSALKKQKARRRQMSDDLNIQIHTYDYIADVAARRVSLNKQVMSW